VEVKRWHIEAEQAQPGEGTRTPRKTTKSNAGEIDEGGCTAESGRLARLGEGEEKKSRSGGLSSGSRLTAAEEKFRGLGEKWMHEGIEDDLTLQDWGGARGGIGEELVQDQRGDQWRGAGATAAGAGEAAAAGLGRIGIGHDAPTPGRVGFIDPWIKSGFARGPRSGLLHQ
jgi:hypothetical protein